MKSIDLLLKYFHVLVGRKLTVVFLQYIAHSWLWLCKKIHICPNWNPYLMLQFNYLGAFCTSPIPSL